jgi:hypothetical protein
MSAPETSAVNGTPAFEQLLEQVRACARDEKRVLLDRILRDLIGDNPQQEYALRNPDGSSYLFLVPPTMHAQLTLTPDRAAELERRARCTTGWKPFSETLARLDAMQRQHEQEG